MGIGSKLGLLALSPVILPFYTLCTVVGLLLPVHFTRWVIFNVPGASWQQGDICEEQWQEDHSHAPVVEIPDIGKILELDFRETRQTTADPGRSLLVLSWNIYLAQNLHSIVEELRKIEPRPDVILLQEDNVYQDLHESSEGSPVYRWAGGAVAKALKMKGAFCAAYFRGQPPQLRGCYGMSILSALDLNNLEALPCLSQPKLVAAMRPYLHGERHFPYAEIQLADDQVVGLVSVHLPSVGYFSERLEMIQTLLAQMEERREGRKKILIVGDMNSLPFIMRYVVPFGSNDLYFSMQSESQILRARLLELGLADPFPDTAGTFPKLGNVKLDWILYSTSDFSAVDTCVQPLLSSQQVVADTGSDHLWICAELLLNGESKELTRGD